MTCQQVRSHVETGCVTDARELARHLAVCIDCRRLADATEEVSRLLQLVRQAAPDAPAAVDSTVLAGYRRHVGEHPRFTGAGLITARVNPVVRFGLAGVSLALLAVTVLFFISSRPATPLNLRTDLSTAPGAPQPVSPESMLTPSEASATASAKNSGPSPRHSAAHNDRRGAALENPFPLGFQSLMYCDPLTCLGNMEMIRLQLPASAVNRVWADPHANGTVVADVLIGADGVARAIRIEN